MTLPLELNNSTLSSSCLKAVSPLSMLHTAWEAVVSRLFLWEKQSRGPEVHISSWPFEDFKQIDSWVLAQPTVGARNDAWKLFSFWICYIQLEIPVSANEKEKEVQSCLRVQICWKKSLACRGLRTRTSSKWVLKSRPTLRQCTIPHYRLKLWSEKVVQHIDCDSKVQWGRRDSTSAEHSLLCAAREVLQEWQVVCNADWWQQSVASCLMHH